ncbi:MAG: glycoside hydrolase family 5 protein [Armatimonadota bacterium]
MEQQSKGGGVTRREFISGAVAGAAVLAGSRLPAFGGSEERRAMAQTKLPRWRGFNLLEMFTTHSDGNWQEDDFRWIADWGFDFVRLPMCYTLWIENDDPLKLSEQGLAKVDRALELGRKYHLHVCMNFHRGPGYSVNPERKEPYNLWKDQAALDAFCFHWEAFAKRYKGVPSKELSFNLINEPAAPVAEMTREDHERVVRATVKAIRAVDPQRLIIADGVQWASVPCPELADLGIAQSCRAYAPSRISHYKAEWAGPDAMKWPEPVWPGVEEWGKSWDRAALEEFYRPWAELASKGVGVHCGEGGAYNKTPHPVFIAWLTEVLDILKSHNIGFALWNFRGSFGLLDSERADVNYETFRGHKLDGKLLRLLRRM